MNSKFVRLSFTILLVTALMLSFASIALAFDSGNNPGSKGPTTIEWTGQGAHDGELDTEYCPSPDDLPDGIDPKNYLHWIVTTGGGSATPGQLTLGGIGSGSYDPWKVSGGAIHYFTPYFTPDPSLLTASAALDVTKTGRGTWILTISHGCDGVYEHLNVSKTAETSYVRTHDWSIEKSVTTDNGYTHEGYPKIWLYIDGHGNETATWTVNVNYEGYEDSGWNVSGDITIENDGTLDAMINSVDDVLAGNSISVDCGVSFPYTLPVGETLTCTYSEDGYVTGTNEVTVTTEVKSYFASADIVWGNPTTEYYKTVNVKDISDLFGEQDLGSVTAPNNKTFTYTKDFQWADYGADGCGDFVYDNTATIVETGESASARLKVNVQCYDYETAFAKGSDNCFIPDFSRWGWSNQITPGEYTWDLWAGAGQCDTSKGTLVGSVTVVYDGDGYVTVTYNVGPPYYLKETHVYAGYGEYPLDNNGNPTVAPGQYTNEGPFDGSPVYVIAHGVVGIPDPDFGP